MLKFISEILLSFSSCFSRTAAFEYFVILVTGFMVRSDSLGATSVIRDLALNPKVYPCLIHFFHASSWEWDTIFYQWLKTTACHAPLHRISGRAVLIGDGTKRAVDGKYMPCTKKMVQESESVSKQEFIHGQFFGAVGRLIGNLTKIFCMPLSIQIHDGDKAICGWEGDESVSHVVQMLRDGFRAARYFGRCLFVLDRYFLTVPMLEEWQNESKQHPDLIHVITRAKKNCTAYEQPEEYKGRGRRPVKGKAVPKLDRYRRKNSPDPLSLVKDTEERARIIRTLKATEGYVLLASIAMGIIQMLCLNYGDKLSVSSFRYLRTSSQQVMAEASMIKYLGRNLFRFMAQQDGLTITKIIFSRQIPAKQEDFDRLVS